MNPDKTIKFDPREYNSFEDRYREHEDDSGNTDVECIDGVYFFPSDFDDDSWGDEEEDLDDLENEEG